MGSAILVFTGPPRAQFALEEQIFALVIVPLNSEALQRSIFRGDFRRALCTAKPADAGCTYLPAEGLQKAPWIDRWTKRDVVKARRFLEIGLDKARKDIERGTPEIECRFGNYGAEVRQLCEVCGFKARSAFKLGFWKLGWADESRPSEPDMATELHPAKSGVARKFSSAEPRGAAELHSTELCGCGESRPAKRGGAVEVSSAKPGSADELNSIEVSAREKARFVKPSRSAELRTVKPSLISELCTIEPLIALDLHPIESRETTKLY